MDADHRWAVLRNMVTSLIKHERIMTTTARAKELRRVAERLVTKAKKNTPTSKRLAGGVVREAPVLVKLFEILGPRYR
jgi:large subunit ribosomal protein L17